MNNKDFLNALALRTGMNAKTVQKATQTLIGEFAERLDADTSLSRLLYTSDAADE